jgi:hypothetical protein
MTRALAVAFAVIGAASPARADAPDDPLTTPVFRKDRPFDYHWRALALPERLVELAFTPFAIIVENIEKKRIDRRVVDFLTSEDERIRVVPRFKLSFGDGLGLGAKLDLRGLSGDRARFDIGALARLDGDWEADVKYQIRIARVDGRILRARVYVEVDDNAPYFGVPGTQEATRRALSVSDGGATVGFDLRALGDEYLTGHVELGALGQRLASGSDPTHPPVVADGDVVVAPPGFGSTSSYGIARVSGHYDTRDVEGRPTVGTLVKAGVESWLEVGGQLGGVRAMSTLEWYIPVLPEGRVLMLAAGGAHAIGFRGNDSIPLALFPTLGRTTYQRGYERDRFRDRTALWSSVEYRFPIWEYLTRRIGLDAKLFVDVGTTWGLADARVRGSYGGGIRAGGENLLVFDLSFGVSSEGYELSLSAERPL